MRALRLIVPAALALALSVAAVSCVDGVTPDCSDAAAKCGPDVDAAFDAADADASIVLPEAGSPDADAGTGSDAGSDADAASDAASD